MKSITILLSLFLTSVAFADDFRLKSNDVTDGENLKADQVFNSFGCIGLNKSPQVSWSGAPKNTKSFSINVYYPDAPTGSGWWHWTIFNIPADVNNLENGASGDKSKLPEGVIEGRTDYGKSEFGGACPPEGDKPHRYIFTIYALDVEKLDLDGNSSGALVGYYLNSHALSKASITATYSRPKSN